MKHSACKGFTFTELLVCIAIVAILAAIAVPNFSLAQTNTNIATATADLQSLKVGLESYKTDLGGYPWMNNFSSAFKPSNGSASALPTLERLTTPISYLGNSAPFYDPFEPDKVYSGVTLATITTASDILADEVMQYFYNARNLRDTLTWGQIDADPVWYFLESSGPDRCKHHMWQTLNRMTTDTVAYRAQLGTTIYDATNGTISRGSIWEVGGAPDGYGTSMAYMINSANSSMVKDWRNY